MKGIRVMANASYEKKLFNALKYGQIEPKSIYDMWLEVGNEGTVEDFLKTLKATVDIKKGVTIRVEEWILYNGIYKATIHDDLIKEDNVVTVNFTSIDAINSGVLPGYVNTIDGSFEIFANKIPDIELSIDYIIN
jgi:hypothetical protein